MLEHASGMIGLPLRLLAREVYDRLSARIGEDRVALVTGDEKRVPRRPDYWVCTTEAMPLTREVDFLAIDEVQLAAHEERGHVFTDRLLHARGRIETWFMGSASMRGLMQSLVPAAKYQEHPRLSRLAFAGASKLQKLPPRSAVVAFSIPELYRTADGARIEDLPVLIDRLEVQFVAIDFHQDKTPIARVAGRGDFGALDPAFSELG